MRPWLVDSDTPPALTVRAIEFKIGVNIKNRDSKGIMFEYERNIDIMCKNLSSGCCANGSLDFFTLIAGLGVA